MDSYQANPPDNSANEIWGVQCKIIMFLKCCFDVRFLKVYFLNLLPPCRANEDLGSKIPVTLFLIINIATFSQ